MHDGWMVEDLFETHLAVVNLDRSIRFYEDVLGLPLAARFPERRVAFFWVGSRGKAMLGLWEAGDGPQRMTLHTAFRTSIESVLRSPALLRERHITPLDLAGEPVDEPVVLCWMPAVAVYFRDPDGNLLEFIAMLPDPPAPERGLMSWSAWKQRESKSIP
jgi:lactoylglutathione lyase